MAPRSEEAWLWFTAVYEAVQEIPPGRVTSYAHIARLLGKPTEVKAPGLYCTANETDAVIRQVGVSLKHLPDAGSGSEFHSGNVPWQRVINSKGVISPRGPSGASRQAAALQREHVQVSRGSMGEFLVDFSTYGWFPSVLPSEEAAESAADSDSESDASEGGDAAGEGGASRSDRGGA